MSRLALIAAAMMLSIAVDAPATNRAESPNIILIMLDDLDKRSLEDMLVEDLLPEIREHIVDRAVAFEQAFVTEAICCPSRATYLSGRYPHNTGITQNFLLYDALPGVPRPTHIEGDLGVVPVIASLPDDKVQLGAIGAFDDSATLAVRLQARGYRTGHVGKYLHGYGGHPEYQDISPTFGARYVPPGWDQWVGLIDPFTYCVYDYRLNINGQVKRYELAEGETESDAIYQTHVLTALSAAFLRDHQHDQEPFFLEVMPLTPHAETCPAAYAPDPPPGSGYTDKFRKRIRIPPRDEGRYVPGFEPRGAYDDDTQDKPDWLAAKPPITGSPRAPLVAEGYENRQRSMYAIDRMVGELFDALAPDVAERTIVIFTSDNGWMYGEHRLVGKQAAYDESIRVPLYVRHPGAAVPASSDAIVINTDFVPTLLDLTGFAYQSAEFDGTSFAPFIIDPARTDTPRRQRFLINYLTGEFKPDGTPSFMAVRTPSVTYVQSDTSDFVNDDRNTLVGLEFYELDVDPHQAHSTVRLDQGEVPRLYPALARWLGNCSGPACQFMEFLVLE